MSCFIPLGLGWKQDLPDFRDYSPQSPEVKELLGRLKRSRSKDGRQPQRVDLREFFPPAADQQGIDSSTAHACIGLVQYFERRAHGRMTPLSRLFLYKTTRNLLRATGDTGADLRTTLKAMVSFGIPAERLWPYEVERFDEEPSPFLYSFAEAYRPIRYVRLDGRNAIGSETLDVVRAFLAAGFPSMFGFSVPDSLTQEGDIPYRPTFDSFCGGQALIAVGYDDRRAGPTRGALLVRNSWGTSWGEQGYGWLPYAYVEEQLAVSFWTLLKSDWIASGEFRQPRSVK